MSIDTNPLAELQRQLTKTEFCQSHVPIDRPVQTPLEGIQWWKTIQNCTEEARHNHLRYLAKNDLYFLLVHILDINRIQTQWHLDWCREIERNHNHIIDISSRGAGKSLIKTFGLIIQKILNDPESCHSLFSHTRPISKDFLRAIKTTFESHVLLKSLFPEIFWDRPHSEAPLWSLDSGIMVKRKSVTRREATVEAWGLVDAMPTSKHFDFLWYDDIQRGPESPYMIQQIDDSLQTSFGLGNTKPSNWTITGVFFRGGSIYENLGDRDVGLLRVRPAINTDDTSPIWNDDEVRETKKQVTPGVWACEHLVDPTKKAEGEGFREEWLSYYDSIDDASSYFWMIVDPGKGFGRLKLQGSRTAIVVVATRPDHKIYLIDAIAAPLSLIQRADWTIAFHRQYHPRRVGYEHYGMQADIEYIKERQKKEGYEFEIVPLTAHINKDERIEWLIPPWKDKRILLPKTLPKRTINDEEIDVLDYFMNQEWRPYPTARAKKDMLDALSWLFYKDFTLTYPEGYNDPSVKRNEIDWDETIGKGSWMSE